VRLLSSSNGGGDKNDIEKNFNKPFEKDYDGPEIVEAQEFDFGMSSKQ
jgi:hypothetical protein